MIDDCGPFGNIPDDNEAFIMHVKTGKSCDKFCIRSQVGIGSSLLDADRRVES